MRLSGRREHEAWKLIIASNRGPVEYHLDQDKKLKKYYGAGGLITALKNVPERISKNVYMGCACNDRGGSYYVKTNRIPIPDSSVIMG